MAQSISGPDTITVDEELDQTIIDTMVAAIERRENTWRHRWSEALKQGSTPAEATRYANQMTH